MRLITTFVSLIVVVFAIYGCEKKVDQRTSPTTSSLNPVLTPNEQNAQNSTTDMVDLGLIYKQAHTNAQNEITAENYKIRLKQIDKQIEKECRE